MIKVDRFKKTFSKYEVLDLDSSSDDDDDAQDKDVRMFVGSGSDVSLEPTAVLEAGHTHRGRVAASGGRDGEGSRHRDTSADTAGSDGTPHITEEADCAAGGAPKQKKQDPRNDFQNTIKSSKTFQFVEKHGAMWRN